MIFWNFYCYNCKSFFDYEKEVTTIRNRKEYITYHCPICDSSNYDKTIVCKICKQNVSEESIGICPSCVRNIYSKGLRCEYCKEYVSKDEVGSCCHKAKQEPKVEYVYSLIDDDTKELIKDLYVEGGYVDKCLIDKWK